MGELGNEADGVGLDGLRADDRRRLARTWLAVTAAVTLVYTWVLTGHSWGLLGGQYFDDFFDAQARSLLDGRWDVPPEVVQFEGFAVDGKTHIYFGPLPALLRMPLFVLTDRFDGRLTIVSMLAAFLLLAWAGFRLTTALRAFVRGEAPVTRRERAATAVLAVAVLTGTPFWLASQAAVHHEAVLWGAATAVAAFDACARWLLDPRATRLAIASGWVAAALLTRQTLGLGALATLGALVAVQLVGRARRARARRASPGDADTAGEPGESGGTGNTGAAGRPGAALLLRRTAQLVRARRPGGAGGLPVWGLVAAVLVPMVLSTIPNVARFHKVFGVPVESQVITFYNTDRQEFLEANRGSFFGAQFVPTTLFQYLRPDAFDIRPDLPWVDFPRTPPTVLGSVTFDAVTSSSSVTVTMPLLVMLAGVGVVVLVRAARRRRPEAWVGVLALGAAVGAGGVLTIGHVANRYLTDVYPAVLIPALVGFHTLLPRLDRGLDGGWRARPRRATTVVALGAVAFGTLATLAMTLEFRHERGPSVSEADRADWVHARAIAPLSSPHVVEIDAAESLPGRAFDGLLAVVGDCDGLYVRVDDRWFPVERGPEVHVYDLTVDLDALADLDDGGWTRAPLLTIGSGYSAIVVAAAPLDDEQVRIDVWTGGSGGWALGHATPLSGEVTIRVPADRHSAPNAISHGDTVLNPRHFFAPGPSTTYRIGAAPTLPTVAPRYPGDIRLHPATHPICEALV